MLNNIPGFATWWKDEVDYLYTNGMPVEYIELMNEPDSWGAWSTGITYSDYNLLVKDLRPKTSRGIAEPAALHDRSALVQSSAVAPTPRAPLRESPDSGRRVLAPPQHRAPGSDRAPR